MDKNRIVTLVFILLVLILFWMMPNTKIDTIGNFVNIIVTPLCAAIASPKVISKLAKFFNRGKS